MPSMQLSDLFIQSYTQARNRISILQMTDQDLLSQYAASFIRLSQDLALSGILIEDFIDTVQKQLSGV